MQSRVLHLVLSLNIGGAENIVKSFIEQANTNVFQHNSCVFDEVGVLGEELINKGYLIHCLNRKPGIQLKLALKLRKIIKRNRIDIIHAHGLTPWFYAILTKLITGCSVLTTLHGFGDYNSFNLKNLRLIKVLTKFTDQVVFVSNPLQIYLNKFVPQLLKKGKVIINGIDCDKFSPVKKDVDCKKRIGIIARLSPIKNHVTLIKAVAEILKFRNDFELIIIGDGEERKNIHNLIDRLSLNQNVHLLGERTDVKEILDSLDIFILPSFHEGTSMTILEAMASGLAVIASNVGGNPYIIDHHVNGLLFDPESKDELIEYILELLNNPVKRGMLSKNARQKMGEKYSFNKMINEYENVYNLIL